jgi:hypothetical protein
MISAPGQTDHPAFLFPDFGKGKPGSETQKNVVGKNFRFNAS